jgi:hypothetical protein
MRKFALALFVLTLCGGPSKAQNLDVKQLVGVTSMDVYSAGMFSAIQTSTASTG